LKGDYSKMMSKEQFIKRMGLIQNFHSEQETLSVMIEKIIDGYAVITMGNYLVNEMIDMITEDFELEDKELISWWLYENVDKVIYTGEYAKKIISVRTLDELYDYIIKINIKNRKEY
jgi:hypothetical protein